MTNDEEQRDSLHRHIATSDRRFNASTLQRIDAAKPMRFILFLSLPLYALDQLTKQCVLRSISPYDARIVLPDFFNLVNVTNTGAAFGSFKGNNTFFVVISIIALVVVTVLLVRPRRSDPWRDVSLALLLAGILGNLTDRLLYGHVIDFLLFNLHVRYADPWPAFNVADSCISIAVVLFIIHSFRRQESTR
jgi:signal peptidase II